jgi:hypothetical protein
MKFLGDKVLLSPLNSYIYSVSGSAHDNKDAESICWNLRIILSATGIIQIAMYEVKTNLFV